MNTKRFVFDWNCNVENLENYSFAPFKEGIFELSFDETHFSFKRIVGSSITPAILLQAISKFPELIDAANNAAELDDSIYAASHYVGINGSRYIEIIRENGQITSDIKISSDNRINNNFSIELQFLGVIVKILDFYYVIEPLEFEKLDFVTEKPVLIFE